MTAKPKSAVDVLDATFYYFCFFAVPSDAGALSRAPGERRLRSDTRYPAGTYERGQDGSYNSQVKGKGGFG